MTTIPFGLPQAEGKNNHVEVTNMLKVALTSIKPKFKLLVFLSMSGLFKKLKRKKEHRYTMIIMLN